ncbi:RagB/SusD family nutrient uptake outer membrane protein [Mucilaginibacter sp. PAMB04168]|uniref:RagB/SusD family nutrient uptake outer membrane protein n=1 Tax=Mucilaginibacter sp. PAMB04168 TaxID=3138567 RepID=UPI0031F616C7
MKKHFYLICSFGLFIFMSTSCRKYEEQPKDWFTKEMAFDSTDKNGIVAGYVLNNIYTYIPDGFARVNGEFLDAATDDAVPSRYNTQVEYFTRGTVTAQNNPEENTGNGYTLTFWANCYSGIRRANLFLANINKVPVTAQTKQYWISEARFLRAYFYWELLKRYGGVPLIGDTVYGLEDDIKLPRNTFAETVDYIISECNSVKNNMRPDPVSTSDFGRVSKGAAVALKCRVLLYAASPLFNGGGFESDATKKALTGYPSNNPNRWQAVADAYTEFKALGYYNLVSSGTPTPFISVFINKMSAEIIFAKQSANTLTLENNQSPVGYIAANVKSQGLTSPTQNLVDAFPMLNGLGINDAGSGYSASAPYNGRDPRLAATVFHNGLIWLNRPVQTYEGGLDKPNNTGISTVQTRTGYYLRKFLGNFATSTTYSNTSHNFPIFRYAEIILNYAEALNELGRTEEAVQQVALIRQRGGIAAGANSRYGIPAGITQANLRTLIMNERRIEFAFEEHRFWDIRRWKIAPQVMTQNLAGVSITNGTTPSFQPISVTTPVWNDRLYHMPIPYDEVLKNPKLIQNEGW